MLSSILNNNSTWAFALVNDDFIYYNRSYFDSRVRFYHNDTLYNFHLVAIPHHISENIYELIARLLNILCSSWRTKFIDLRSDDENTMTRKFQDVITQLE